MHQVCFFFAQGFEVRVGAVPIPRIVDRMYRVDSDDPREVSKKYRLSEGYIIHLICKVKTALITPPPSKKKNIYSTWPHDTSFFFFQKLGCHPVFRNPDDFLWGSVTANGTATGLFRDLVDDKVHLAIGSVISDHGRHQVAAFSTFIQRTLSITFASPRSEPYR